MQRAAIGFYVRASQTVGFLNRARGSACAQHTRRTRAVTSHGAFLLCPSHRPGELTVLRTIPYSAARFKPAPAKVVKKAVVMQNEHISASPSGISAPAHPEETCTAAPVVPERPECCGTGCTVCVLDYPELFATTPTTGPEATELALLEAIERAQQQVAEFFAAPDSEQIS